MRKYKGAGIALFKKQNNDYAILLGKRTIKPNKGKWSIPGGGFEKSDNSLFETAIRELREETGINFSNSVNEKNAIICSFHYPCFEWKTFMFEVTSDFHVPERFCYEFSEMRFISLKEIHQYKLAFGVRKEIKRFLFSISPVPPQERLASFINSANSFILCYSFLNLIPHPIFIKLYTVKFLIKSSSIKTIKKRLRY